MINKAYLSRHVRLKPQEGNNLGGGGGCLLKKSARAAVLSY